MHDWIDFVSACGCCSRKKVWVQVTRTFGVLALAYVIFSLQFPDGISRCAIFALEFRRFRGVGWYSYYGEHC